MKNKMNRSRCSHLILAVAITGLAGLGITQAVGADAQTSNSSSQPSTNPFSTYTPARGPEHSVAEISAVAMEESEKAGVPSPSAVTIDEGTLRATMIAVNPDVSLPTSPGGGQEAWLNSKVALVTMHGNFALNNVPIPPGAETPTGSIFAVTIDTHSDEVIGRSLPVAAPNLEQLNAVPLESPKATATIADRTGLIAGHVYLGGGPALRRGERPRKVRAPHYRVVVTQATGNIATASVLAETTTKGDGSFSIRVKPGRYQVAGQFSSGRFCFAKDVTVRSGKPTKTTLECSAK